jgi:hypothetical protein
MSSIGCGSMFLPLSSTSVSLALPDHSSSSSSSLNAVCQLCVSCVSAVCQQCVSCVSAVCQLCVSCVSAVCAVHRHLSWGGNNPLPATHLQEEALHIAPYVGTNSGTGPLS